MYTRDTLKDKVALITGTGGGQGFEAALRFARAGALVVGCDIAGTGHADLRSRIEGEGGRFHFSDNVDLGDPEAAAAWVREAASVHGRIDILYNNASGVRFVPFAQMSLEDWNFTITNELSIIFHVTRPAWEWLRKQGGVIINTASVNGHAAGIPGCAAHAAAKGGVLALTRQLAQEGAPDGIRAVSISPGVIETPGTAPLLADPGLAELVLSRNMIRRAGKPEEVADLAVFLASDAAAFMTGSDTIVDGGMLAA